MDRHVGKILIVDDEPDLLKMMSIYLERRGYSVEMLAGTEAAWARLQSGIEDYSVVVLDATIRGLPAAEVALRALDASPGLSVIMASGYPLDMGELEAAAPGRVVSLQKPFSPEMLADLMRRMIGPKEENL